jgi:hypothetical protein
MAEIAAENPNYINISCVNSTYTPTPPPENACGCPIPWDPQVPAGCVQMENDDGFFDIPVRNTSVRVRDRRFGGTDILPTDDNGCWRHTKRFSNRMWVWNKFSNDNGKMRVARPGRPWQYISITSDYVGVFRDQYNRILLQYPQERPDPESQGRRYFTAAAMLVGLEEYYDICLANGIVFPRDRINMSGSVVINGGFGGGAPMLQKNVFQNAGLAIPLLTALLKGSVIPLYSAILGEYVAPDIIIVSEQRDRLRIGLHNTIYHELAHASHYATVGEPYWRPYRWHIVRNDMAGNGVYGQPGNFASGSNPGHVAVGEMWGFHIEREFGLNGFNIEDDREFVSVYLPTGLIHDLIDVDVDPVTDSITWADPAIPTLTVLDRVEGFTIAQVFEALRTECTTLDDFEATLKQQSLSLTPTNANDYEDLFDVYNMLD